MASIKLYAESFLIKSFTATHRAGYIYIRQELHLYLLYTVTFALFATPAFYIKAESSGFVRLTSEAWLTGSITSEDTWGVCVVLRKL